jgi:energy-coupling factor transporter transmembrane protein EcfT
MARLSALISFRSGDSGLHRLDVRVKFAVFAVLSLAILAYGPLPLTVLSTFAFLLARYAGLSPVRILVELRFFMFLLLLVIAARALTIPGTPLVDFPWLPVTREGIYVGALTAWRLFLVAVLGLVFVVTTRPSAVKAAVLYFLKPFPRLPAARIGTMLGLQLRFIPLVFRQAEATLDAQRARGIENRRNPAFRMICFVVPFLRRLFTAADRLTDAMEARCYTDQRTEPVLTARKRDWWVLCSVIGIVGLLSLYEICSG